MIRTTSATSPVKKPGNWGVLLLVLALIVTKDTEGSCATSVNPALSGYCFTYPADGVCGPGYAGRNAFLTNDTSFLAAEKAVRATLALIKTNQAQVSDDCFFATERYVCSNYYPRCITLDSNEVAPQLTCQSECEAYWDICRASFDLYLEIVIEQYHVTTVEDVNIDFCGNGSWTSLPQPSDYFGGRPIGQQPTWIEGYRGELRHPVSIGHFKLLNGTVVGIPCGNIAPLTASLDLGDTKCAYPLTQVVVNGETTCEIPCPFPVIDTSDLRSIGWAFIAPAILGMMFSVFVCMDSLWVMFETTDGFGHYDHVRHYWARSMANTRNHESHIADDVKSSSSADKGGQRHRRGQVRSSMVYAFVGSILGIIYFCVGPLMTLLEFSDVSCGDKKYLDVRDLLSGAQDINNPRCRAQRVAPFILQGIFNIMLYALFRVLMMVDQRFKQWHSYRTSFLSQFVRAYCWLGPFVTGGIALGLDKTTDDITLLYGQLARNAAICTMRLTIAQELILVFLPFIITGCLITGMSLYIWIRLSDIRAGVKEYVMDRNKDSDKSLQQLILRLSVLGVTTFLVLIILMAATGYLINAMQVFSPSFNAWFACQSTSADCTTTAFCPDLQAAANAVSPPPAAFAVQIAAMSCISLLLSGFFTAQALPRVYREWRDGILSQKFDNVLEGRPIYYHVETKNASSAANGGEAIKSGLITSTGELDVRNKKVAPGKVGSNEATSVAAYMFVGSSMGEHISPVFEHEMRQTRSVDKSDS